MILEKYFNELNPSQLTAVLADIDSCTKITAGAGCGKTKVIASRYLKLVLDMKEKNIENPLDKILVITFTDKAAGEMKARIENILKSANINYLGEKLWISTFHKFTSSILKKYSIEVNLNPDYSLVDEVQQEEIFENIKEKIKNFKSLEIADFDKLLKMLNLSENIFSYENFKKIFLIDDIDNIFGEIFSIIKKIKAKGLSPKEFLDLSINAEENFSKNLVCLNKIQYTKEDYETSWEKELINYSDENCNFSDAFSEISKTKTILNKNGQRNAEKWTIEPDFEKNIKLAEEKEKIFTRIVALIYAIFQNELLRASLADFDDLINKTIEIFKSKPNILKKYKNQFKHIIIDEFQDTNGAQLELIKLLLNDESPNITFVGDTKQSIYAFRYAQAENLNTLHKIIEKKYKKNYPEVSLSTNYRSTPEIIEKVNNLVEKHLFVQEKLNSGKSFENKKTKVFKKVFENITSADELKTLQAEYITDEILKIKEETNFKFSDFVILVNSHAEADFIEKFLAKKNIAANKKVNKSFFESKNTKNCASLLMLADNKFDEYALVRLLSCKFSNAEIYELKKKLDENLAKAMAFEKIRNMNFAQKFFSEESSEIVDEFSEYSSKIRKIFNNFSRLKSAYSAFSELIISFNLINYASDWENIKAQTEIKTFEKIIINWQNERKYAPSYEFLKYLKDISQSKDFELPKIIMNEENAVNIMTVHASKGLEFKSVFVTYQVAKSKKSEDKNFIFDPSYEGKLPFGIILTHLGKKPTPKAVVYKQIWQKPRNLAENLRLFYVAITRAEEFLTLISFNSYSNQKPIECHNVIENNLNVM